MNDANQYKNANVQLKDHTTLYKPYGVSKRFSTLMGIIPNEDLEGLGAIHIYDDSFPKEITGIYYPAGFRGQFAEIEIYLNQTLGHLALVSDEKCRFQMVRNRLFLSTFGMMFLAEALFHEIGHHKFMGVDLKEYKTSIDQETDAKKYADQLLRKAFPCFLLYYPFTNIIYHLLFRKFIKKSNKFAQSKTIVDPGYFRSAGNMYLAEEEYKKAVEAFSRAIEIDPCDSYAYF
jgi:tetratricopeptide (TPR) repeat protein